MSNTIKKLSVIAILTTLLIIGLQYTGILPTLDTFLSSAEAASLKKTAVPDGFVHQNTTVKESKIIHTYQKTPPKKASNKDYQNAEEAFQRYIDALPNQLEKEIGKEFKTLSHSLQNARVYVEATETYKKAKENELAMDKFTEQSQKANTTKALTSNRSKLLVGEQNQTETIETQKAKKKPKKLSLDNIRIEGVFGTPNHLYIRVLDSDNKMLSVKEGQRFDKRFFVKKVTIKHVVINEGKKSRTISVM